MKLRDPGIVLLNLSRAVLTWAAACLPGLDVLIVPPRRGFWRRGWPGGPDHAARRPLVNEGTPQQGLQRFLAALQPVSV